MQYIGMDKAASGDHSCIVTVRYKDGVFEVVEIIRDPDQERMEEYKRKVAERAVRGE